MKILHIAISKGWHAQVAKACEQIECQRDNNISPVLITLKGSLLFKQLSDKGTDFPIYTINHHESVSLVRLINEISRRHNIELIHIHGENGLRRLWLAGKLSQKNIPVIMSIRDNPRRKFFRKIAWEAVNRVIVPNNLVKNYIHARRLPKVKIDVIEPFVDTGRFKPSGSQNAAVTIAMFARYAQVKGFDYFFEACRKVVSSGPGPECRFVAAGPNFSKHKSFPIQDEPEMRR